MKYEDIRLNVSNDTISDYKVFKGIKLYSEMFKAEDGKKIINKLQKEIMYIMKGQI